MHILIPCKKLDVGKSRLSECLDPFARRELCKWLLTQTIERAFALAKAADISVVTADPEAAAIAHHYAIEPLPDPGNGLNAALEVARATVLKTASECALLVLPIDLPFASADAISQFLSRPGDIVIAPDESETGTNLLLLRLPALKTFPFIYGPGSFTAHLAAAQAGGLRIATLKDWRLAFDIDGPAQYSAWQSLQGRTHDAARIAVNSTR